MSLTTYTARPLGKGGVKECPARRFRPKVAGDGKKNSGAFQRLSFLAFQQPTRTQFLSSFFRRQKDVLVRTLWRERKDPDQTSPLTVSRTRPSFAVPTIWYRPMVGLGGEAAPM